MVEIYLFVNPLGGVCLEIEKEIIQLSVNDKKKIQLRFIPLLNLNCQIKLDKSSILT